MLSQTVAVLTIHYKKRYFEKRCKILLKLARPAKVHVEIFGNVI